MKRMILCGVVGAALSLAAGAAPDIFTDGEFFVGCNYWAKNAGMYMWSNWKPETVRAEVAALARHGTRVLRVFPLWSD